MNQVSVAAGKEGPDTQVKLMKSPESRRVFSADPSILTAVSSEGKTAGERASEQSSDLYNYSFECDERSVC